MSVTKPARLRLPLPPAQCTVLLAVATAVAVFVLYSSAMTHASLRRVIPVPRPLPPRTSMERGSAAVAAFFDLPNASLALGPRADLVVGDGNDTVTVRDLAAGVAPSDAWFRTTMTTLRVSRAFVYNNNRLVKEGGYEALPFLGNQSGPYRMKGVAGVPRSCRVPDASGRTLEPCTEDLVPFFIQFSNVFVDGNGRVFVPQAPRKGRVQNVHLYDLAGGCCDSGWTMLKGRAVRVKPREIPRGRLGLSLPQHHGDTYHHIIHQIIPRLLTFWKILVATPKSVNVVVARKETVKEILRSIGIPRARIHILPDDGKGYRFYSKLWVPGPLLQDRAAYAVPHQELATPKVLLAAARNGQASTAPASAESEKPTLLLIERASERTVDGCNMTRCIRNFDDLRSALEQEFGDILQIQVLPSTAENLFETGMDMASRAKILVGVHGAGFRNMIFMESNSTYAIHFGGNHMWRLYASLASTFDVSFRNIWTPEADQNSRNIDVPVDALLVEVWRILEDEGLATVQNRTTAHFSTEDYALQSQRNADLVQMFDPVTRNETYIYK